MSLQLQVGMALDQGLEEVHLLCEEYVRKDNGKTFQKDLLRLFLSYNKKTIFHGADATQLLRPDKQRMERVLDMAIQRHRGEFRDSGHPYIAHVLSAGLVLARLGMPAPVVYAGILHDTVEDHKNANEMLNSLWNLSPEVAGYVYSVSAPQTRDAIEKDAMLMARISDFVKSTGNIYPLIIKCADGIANLHDVEFMQARDGRNGLQRQQRFLFHAQKELLIWAKQIDEQGIIPLKNNGGEIFLLEEYIADAIEWKLQIIEDTTP